MNEHRLFQTTTGATNINNADFYTMSNFVKPVGWYFTDGKEMKMQCFKCKKEEIQSRMIALSLGLSPNTYYNVCYDCIMNAVKIFTLSPEKEQLSKQLVTKGKTLGDTMSSHPEIEKLRNRWGGNTITKEPLVGAPIVCAYFYEQYYHGYRGYRDSDGHIFFMLKQQDKDIFYDILGNYDLNSELELITGKNAMLKI